MMLHFDELKRRDLFNAEVGRSQARQELTEPQPIAPAGADRDNLHLIITQLPRSAFHNYAGAQAFGSPHVRDL